MIVNFVFHSSVRFNAVSRPRYSIPFASPAFIGLFYRGSGEGGREGGREGGKEAQDSVREEGQKEMAGITNNFFLIR